MDPRMTLPMSCRHHASGMMTLISLTLMAGCAMIRSEVPRTGFCAINQPQQTELAKGFAPQLGAAPGLSGFRLLPDGQEAVLVRAVLADAAQRTLDLQYHIVAPDATGTLLIYHAIRVAQRGVRVRLLIDDLDVWATVTTSSQRWPRTPTSKGGSSTHSHGAALAACPDSSITSVTGRA